MEENDPHNEGDDEFESDNLEADIMRADRPFGSTRFGTTPQEALEGEGLDRALAQEVPTPDRVDEELQLVDEAAADVEDELIGDAADVIDAFAPPEEAAVQVTDDPPGLTDHPEPSFDDDLDAVEEYLEETDDGRGPS